MLPGRLLIRSGRRDYDITRLQQRPRSFSGADGAPYCGALQPFQKLTMRLRHGKEALDEYRHKFVDRYVENYAMLARIIRVEANVKHSTATPKAVDEALAELESKVGAKDRKKFEKFLREVAEDEDVESN
jgi:hypothetical protein